MWMVGIDVGGTFTDIVLVHPGGPVRSFKVLSVHGDDTAAGVDFGSVRRSLETLSDVQGDGSPDLALVAHATTVATNALIERKGGRTGLITTEGFRDVLEIGRQRMPKLYDVGWIRPAPLVRRALRRELAERSGAFGKVEREVDLDAAELVIRELVSDGVESLAVSLLNSYANDHNERRVAEAAERVGVPVSLSSAVAGRIKEFERTSTTVVNAYLLPLVERYVSALQRGLTDLGSEATVYVMQSSGGMTPLEEARRRPVLIIESGPAAGVIAAKALAHALDETDVLTLDMGGTTSKASIIEDGEHLEVDELDVGGEANQTGTALGHRGYVVALPSVLVTEVGAGGGSIAWLDGGGALQVGPFSAGANPGPACYGLGGSRPTVTDAAVLLGYLDATELGEGDTRLTIDADLARRAVDEHISQPGGLDVTEAAWGIHRIANARMARAIRAVTIERGRDPRTFSMVVFGGAGPLHGAAIAEDVGVERLIIPVRPGVFSATGLLLSDASREAVRSEPRPLSTIEPRWLEKVFTDLEREVGDVSGSNPATATQNSRRIVAVRYEGQAGALPIPLRGRRVTAAALAQVREDFEAEHLRSYGHVASNSAVEIDEYRVQVSSATSSLGYTEFARLALEGRTVSTAGDRRLFFGDGHGWCQALVIDRGALGGQQTPGPLVIAEPDTTVVVPPGWEATLDALGNVVLEREASGRGGRS